MQFASIFRTAVILAASSIVAHSASAATQAYQYVQPAADITSRTGYLATTSGPITFDFVLPFALAASQTYTFGYQPISTYADGSLESFSFVGGSPLANFSNTDFPAAYTSYGSVFRTKASLSIVTAADSSIRQLGLVLENNVPQIDPVFEFRDISISYEAGANGYGVVSEQFYNGHSGYDSALYSRSAGASIELISTSADAVPEPANWALMVVGFGGLGAVLRSRRGRAAYAA